MKIIELLDKIAKGEISTKIKVNYKNARGKHENWETLDYYIYSELGKRCESELKAFLNDEIEIIEKDKKIEKLEPIRGSELVDLRDKNRVKSSESLTVLLLTLNKINDKINELIDELNKMKEGK